MSWPAPAGPCLKPGSPTHRPRQLAACCSRHPGPGSGRRRQALPPQPSGACSSSPPLRLEVLPVLAAHTQIAWRGTRCHHRDMGVAGIAQGSGCTRALHGRHAGWGVRGSWPRPQPPQSLVAGQMGRGRLVGVRLCRCRRCSAPSGRSGPFPGGNGCGAGRTFPAAPRARTCHDRQPSRGSSEIMIPGCSAMHVKWIGVFEELSTQDRAPRRTCAPYSRSRATWPATAHPKAGPPRQCRHSAVRPTDVGNILLLDSVQGATQHIIPSFITNS